MKFDIKKPSGSKIVMRVKEATRQGKNVYKDIIGHEEEINEVLIDFNTDLKDILICMNTLYPGNVNGELKMMRGHSHNAEEVYLVLSGKGYIIFDKKRIPVKKDSLITIPKNVWHRTVNTGKEKLVFLTIFQRHEGSHLKKY
jgi:oxalate decarboxylase/phosphoglucose isomerase-like protein (cupin superfamily)